MMIHGHIVGVSAGPIVTNLTYSMSSKRTLVSKARACSGPSLPSGSQTVYTLAILQPYFVTSFDIFG